MDGTDSVENIWMQAIDSYCERLGPGFWAEPANAITNAAFILGALFVWRLAAARGRTGDWAVMALVGLEVVIGIGSFLFHTFANRWSVMADVIPIMLFILVYLHLATVRLWRAPWWGGLIAAAAFFPVSAGATALLTPVFGDLNGSMGYVPTLLILGGYGAGLALRGHPAGRGLLIGAGILAVSLTFRTLDDQTGPVCEMVPLGTHWLWHTLNGIMLAWVTWVLVVHGAPRDGGRLAPPPDGG